MILRSLFITVAVFVPLYAAAQAEKPEAHVRAFGGRVTGEEVISGTIKAVDAATRAITVQGSRGGGFTFTAGPDVRNFDQIKVGDAIDMVTTEDLSVIVTDAPGEPKRNDSVDVARAAEGSKPGMVVVRRTKGSAVIEGIDYEKRTATLRGANRTVVIEVSPEAVHFKEAKVGDRVLIEFTQTTLITLHAP